MVDVEEQLHDAGARWRAEQRAPVVDVERATRSPRPRTRTRRGVALAAAAIVIALLVGFFARDTSAPHLQVNVPPTTVAPLRSAINVNSAIAQVEPLAVDGTRLWVSGYASAAGVSKPAHLQQIDATSGKVTAEVVLPDDAPYGIHVGAGALWVNAQQKEDYTELLKVDIATMKIVARIRNVVSGQTAVTPDAVWSVDGVGGLKRIDPATARVVATIPLAGGSIYATLGVVAGPDGVWVANGYNGTVQRIDPATNTAGPVIRIAANTGALVDARGSLWITTASGDRLMQLVGNKVSRTVDLGEPTGGLATEGAALWLSTRSAYVLRVDMQTGAVTKVALPAGARAAVVAADPDSGSVWVATLPPNPRLVRIPTTSSPAEPHA